MATKRKPSDTDAEAPPRKRKAASAAAPKKVSEIVSDDAPEAPDNYARLAQRINGWLTSITPAGVLYETDLRLRPDGAGGLLVSPLASFRDYQQKQAWGWEHQALTRARFVAGDGAIGQAFEKLRIAILREPRDLEALRRAITAMRQKILDAHPNTSGRFDLKHDRGGMIEDWQNALSPLFTKSYAAFAHAVARLRPRLSGGVVVSNVRGPSDRFALHGGTVENLVSVGHVKWVSGLNVTAWSYAGQLNLALYAAEDAFPDLARVARHLGDSFEELAKAAAREAARVAVEGGAEGADQGGGHA